MLFADKDREDIVYAANKEVNIKVCIKVTGCIVRQRESRNWTLWTFCAHKCTQQCTQQCTRYSSEQEGGRAAEMQTEARELQYQHWLCSAAEVLRAEDAINQEGAHMAKGWLRGQSSLTEIEH